MKAPAQSRKVRCARHPPHPSAAYPSGIDDEQLADSPDDEHLASLPIEDESLEIRPDVFAVNTGFLRAGSDPNVPPPADEGPEWSFDEADEQAHDFLLAVAGERTVAEFLDDPVEHARANGLMLLFSEGVQVSFETYLERMPEPRVEAWRDLIAGGASSEAFGPLTLQEQLSEQQVSEALQKGRKQRIINLSMAVVVLIAAVVGGVVLWNAFGPDEGRTEGAFRLEDADEPPAVAALTGGAPVVNDALTASLSSTVAVIAGDGDEADRIVQAPFAVYPHPPGAVRASLFQYAGSAHVVFVGPNGFADDSCLRASVVTADLRPLDTVTFGACAQPVGRTPTIGCLGPTAVLVDLDIPTGEVPLPEGGSGFADAVRLQMIADNEDYEVLTLRGTIAVSGEEGSDVPRFGGATGETLTFDLGADRAGSCDLTGDLPGPR